MGGLHKQKNENATAGSDTIGLTDLTMPLPGRRNAKGRMNSFHHCYSSVIVTQAFFPLTNALQVLLFVGRPHHRTLGGKTCDK